MEPEFDRELDVLLRRAAARPAARAAGRAHAAPHPDADELAAFAENALPSAARAAAIAHLADCVECRRAAAALASAAGTVAELDRPEGAAASVASGKGFPGWRARLAALFAPRVLRFAAPVLALCLVGVVSYVAMRSGRVVGDGNLTAERAPADVRQTARDAAPDGGAAANMNSSAPSDEQLARRSEGNPAAAGQGAGPAGRAKDDGGPGRGRDTSSIDARRGEPATQPEAAFADRTGGAQAGSAPAPAARATEAASGPKKEAEARRRDETEEVARVSELARQDRSNQARGFENQQAPDGSRNQSRPLQNLGSNAAPPPQSPGAREAAKARPAPARGAAAGGRTAEGDAARTEEKADGEAGETRTVEGRRFRRLDGVWVDVNYRDSLPTLGVRRGTEAYAALVAELPEVGRAAERLGGEVVVVARGRAYRIKP